MNISMTDDMFIQGQGFEEYDLHNRISEHIMREVNSRLSGRDFNFIVTVETKRKPQFGLWEYEVKIIE